MPAGDVPAGVRADDTEMAEGLDVRPGGGDSTPRGPAPSLAADPIVSGLYSGSDLKTIQFYQAYASLCHSVLCLLCWSRKIEPENIVRSMR